MFWELILKVYQLYNNFYLDYLHSFNTHFYHGMYFIQCEMENINYKDHLFDKDHVYEEARA